MAYNGHPNTTRKLLTAFMDFFSKIELERYNADFTRRSLFRVPVQYCSHEKWLQIYESLSARKQMNLDANQAPVEMQWILPRISVSLSNMIYDTERHINKVSKIREIGQSNSGRGMSSTVYAPVPYNLEIEVNAISRTLDDAFQMMEQIIPYFSPGMSIDVCIIDEDTSESIPIILTSMSFDFPQDVQEQDERLFTITYGFSMRANYYIQKGSRSRIEHAQINFNPMNSPIDIDTSLTLFEQYVSNANPVPLSSNVDNPPTAGFKDTTQVKLVDKGLWASDGVYKNWDIVSYGNNKFIWIGGSINNVEPSKLGWEKCWTLQTVIQNMGIRVTIE